MVVAEWTCRTTFPTRAIVGVFEEARSALLANRAPRSDMFHKYKGGRILGFSADRDCIGREVCSDVDLDTFC